MRCCACCACCACRTLVTHLTASCVVRAHAMQCDRTSPVRSRATGVEPPGLSDPYIVLDEAPRVGPRSNTLGAAECGAAIDGASMARRRRATHGTAACGAAACAALKAAAVSPGCAGRRSGPIRLHSSSGRGTGAAGALCACMLREPRCRRAGEAWRVCAGSIMGVGLSAFLGSVAVPLPPAHPTQAALRKRACAGTLCDVSSVCGTIVLYWVPFGPIVPKRISVRVCCKESDWWSAFSAALSRRPLGADTLPLHAAIPHAATLTRNRSAWWSASIVTLSRTPSAGPDT